MKYCDPHWKIVSIGRVLKPGAFKGACNKAFEDVPWEERIAQQCEPTRPSVYEEMMKINDECKAAPEASPPVPHRVDEEKAPGLPEPPEEKKARREPGMPKEVQWHTDSVDCLDLPPDWKSKMFVIWNEDRYGPLPKKRRRRQELTAAEEQRMQGIEEEIEERAEMAEAVYHTMMGALDELFVERWSMVASPVPTS